MGAWSSQYPVQVLGADQRDCGQPRRPRLVRGLGGIGKGSMIAAALTSPCLIRSDGRTITIEKLRFIECADGRFSTGVAGIPLRHATYSGTDLEQGRVKRSEEHTSELQSLMRISYAVFCLKKKKVKYKRQT